MTNENRMINLDKNHSQFFISICMVRGHTLIVAGVKSNNFGENPRTELLLDVGKSIVLEKRQQGMLAILWQMLRGTLDSTIQNEKVFLDRKLQENEIVKRQIEYMAFEISYEHYHSLLTKLHCLNPNLKAYIPLEESKENTLTLKYDTVSKMPKDEKDETGEISKIKQHQDKLSFTHHCRKDARRLLHATIPKTSIEDFGVSSNIQGHLLCKSSITNGKFGKEIILLPLPPSAYNLDEQQTKLLFKLYQRMEKIYTLKQEDPITREKFEKTKELYKSIISKEKPSLNEVLNAIIRWAEENRKIVDKHRRGWHFFQPTATRNFVNKIIKQKEQLVTKML